MGPMALTTDEQKKLILKSEIAMRTLGEKIDAFQKTFTQFEEKVNDFSQIQSKFVQISEGYQKNLDNMSETSNQHSDILTTLQSLQEQIDSIQQNALTLSHDIGNLSDLKVQIGQLSYSIAQIQEHTNQQPDIGAYFSKNDKKIKSIHDNVVELSDTTNKLIYIMIALFVIAMLSAFFFSYF